jgi:hypothetical protein
LSIPRHNYPGMSSVIPLEVRILALHFEFLVSCAKLRFCVFGLRTKFEKPLWISWSRVRSSNPLCLSPSTTTFCDKVKFPSNVDLISGIACASFELCHHRNPIFTETRPPTPPAMSGRLIKVVIIGQSGVGKTSLRGQVHV